ncbi:hypothetical protein SAMN04487761_10655 [Lachnospiraceae bacterium C7]|nr:hypothetical protein SAMN04487761_10655 [Lachnospiraceae bacterium C7]
MPRRHGKYKFTGKKHSRKGMIATGIAAAMILLFIIVIVMAFEAAGKMSAYVGSAGVLAVFGTAISVVLAIQSMHEEDSFKLFPRIAMVTSVLAALCWFGTYALGFYMTV